MFNENELQKVDITVQVMYKWIRENIKDSSRVIGSRKTAVII